MEKYIKNMKNEMIYKQEGQQVIDIRHLALENEKFVFQQFESMFGNSSYCTEDDPFHERGLMGTRVLKRTEDDMGEVITAKGTERSRGSRSDLVETTFVSTDMVNKPSTVKTESLSVVETEYLETQRLNYIAEKKCLAV